MRDGKLFLVVFIAVCISIPSAGAQVDLGRLAEDAFTAISGAEDTGGDVGDLLGRLNEAILLMESGSDVNIISIYAVGSTVYCMPDVDVIQVSSKGRVTIPVKFRKALSLDKGSYLYVVRAGNVLVLKKVDENSLEAVSKILDPIAESDGLTREILYGEAEKARKAFLDERNLRA